MSLHQTLPPGCEPECHGCRHRSMETAASLAQKTAYLRRTLQPWAERVADVVGPEAPRRLGYRDRVTLSARWTPQVGWRFGLVRRDELIAIHDCPVHSARVRSLVRVLVRCLPGGDELPLAYLHVSGAQATLIVKTRQVPVATLQRAAECAMSAGIEGLWLHEHPAAGRRLFARSGWQLLAGSPESRDQRGLLHGPTAFAQAMPELHQRAIAVAREHLAACAGTSVLDLYCGIGATLREWTDAGAAALGVELSGEAVTFAARNAPRAEVLRGTCTQRLPQLRAWWHAREGDRVAFVNPPRSGLEPEVTEALAGELRPPRLAYLSCSAGTLARDLRSFDAAGYEVASIQAYDFFPLTHHVEAVALLDRR